MFSEINECMFQKKSNSNVIKQFKTCYTKNFDILVIRAIYIDAICNHVCEGFQLCSVKTNVFSKT